MLFFRFPLFLLVEKIPIKLFGSLSGGGAYCKLCVVSFARRAYDFQDFMVTRPDPIGNFANGVRASST